MPCLHSDFSPLLTVIIGGVSVILKKGDITKETVDVIVNSNNQNLNLNNGKCQIQCSQLGKLSQFTLLGFSSG